MEESYLELTEYNLKDCRRVTDDSLIFKEIAKNLACIADEIHDNTDTLSCAADDIVGVMADGFDIDLYDDDEDDGKEPFLQMNLNMEDAPKCFICGKPVDFASVGGVIIDGDGNTTCACAGCKAKFDAIMGGIIGRKVS